MPTLFIVDYKQHVVEGDNYAGFSGYRDRQKVLLSRADYLDWMLESARDFGSEDKVIKRIQTAKYETPEEKDVAAEVKEAKTRYTEEQKREEKAALLREKERLEKKLKALS